MGAHLDDLCRHGLVRLALELHVAFEVDVEEFEHEVELLVGVHDVHEPEPRHPSTRARMKRGARTSSCMCMRVITHRTMFSSLSSLRRLISLIAVLGTPSSSCSSLIFFSATISPLPVSRAL